jgi:hypothetical protein
MGRPAKWDYNLKRPDESGRSFRRRMFLESQGVVKSPAIGVPEYRTSKRFDPDGVLKGYSTFQRQDDVERVQKWAEVRQAFFDDLPVRTEIEYHGKGQARLDDNSLRTCFPIGDHHLGMLAWRPEVGASYDLDIGERLLGQAMSALYNRTDYATSALLVGLGDFMHYDGKLPITQRGGNILDSDGRYRKMIRVALRSWRTMIDLAAEKFAEVHVIVASGNHDEFSMAFVSEALALHYGANPRIHIDTTAGRFHYHRYGLNLIGVTHGDLAKAEQLPGVMAFDRPHDWANTTHHTWWTGHVHHYSDRPYAGCNVESFGILPPPDAYAFNLGYRSKREMKAIVLNFDGGEYCRYTITPEELDG